jgi:putative thioredoxin
MHIVIFVVFAFVAGMLLHRHLTRERPTKRSETETPSSPYEANVTTSTFDEMVLRTSNDTPVLVDFHAAWCPPCQHLGPVLAEMAKSYAGTFLLAKVDVDAEPSLSQTYNIRSMPTVLLFRDGRSVAQFVGARREHAVRFFLAQNGILPPAQTVAASQP